MKILIAEDDLFFQKFYSSQLSEKGFTIEIAANGEEALEKIKTFHPDLLLLDIIMPKMDGFELLKIKAENPTIKKIPTLVFSTLGQDADMQKAIQLGASGYINKSFFDLDALLKKIESIVHHA